MTHRLIITLSVLLILMSCESLKKEKVSLIVHNATIYTVNERDESFEAMAIKDGLIIAIGPEHEIMNKYEGKEVIDARNKFVYPGFIDGHCHFFGYGLSLQQVDLKGTKSWEECLERITEFAKSHPEGWLIGRGWDQNDWQEKNFPTNEQLNILFPERPVFLGRIDGHAAIANQAALDLAKINTGTSVEGGEFIKNANGLTGVLVDNAMTLVNSIIPSPSKDQKIKGLLAAQKNCFEVGLTTVDDAGLMWYDIDLIDSLQKDSVLIMRVYAMLSDERENLEKYLASGPYKTDLLNVRSFKFYADGALGSRGAAMLEPYHDQPSTKGLILIDYPHLQSTALKLRESGFQMNTHCIGDSANRMILNLYGDALNGVNDKRWRIEHAQVIDPTDIDKFGQFSIIPSVQPTHATSDMYWAENRLGSERIHNAYAYQALYKQNGIIALGTDFPVESISPLKTFYAAVFREDDQGVPEGGFEPKNALTRMQVLKGMTIWNAIANFEENEKGSLEVGKVADFVILNSDLLSVSKEQFKNVKVESTYLNGQKVF